MYARRFSEMNNARIEEQLRRNTRQRCNIDFALGRTQRDTREAISTKRQIKNDYERVSLFLTQYIQAISEDNQESCDKLYKKWEKNKECFDQYKTKKAKKYLSKRPEKYAEESRSNIDSLMESAYEGKITEQEMKKDMEKEVGLKEKIYV